MVGENKLRKLCFITLFLLPSLFGLIVLFVIPMIQTLYISFTQWDFLTAPKFIGIQNYVGFFKNADSVLALRNTLTYVVCYTPLVLCIGLVTASLLNVGLKGIKVYRALNFVPVLLSWVVVSLLWSWLYSPDSGLINYLLSLIGIRGRAWLYDPGTAMGAIIVASLWKDLGYVAMILLSGLQGISQEYYESADLDGAGTIQKFFKITIPQLSPVLFFLLITLMISSFQVFDQVFVMTKGGPYDSTRTLVLSIYESAFQFGNVGSACAQAWVLLLIVLAVTLVQNILQKRWVYYES